MQRRFVTGLVYFDLFMARPKRATRRRCCGNKGQKGVFELASSQYAPFSRKSPFSRFGGGRRQKSENMVVSARGRRTPQAPALRTSGCANARKYDYKSSSLYAQSTFKPHIEPREPHIENTTHSARTRAFHAATASAAITKHVPQHATHRAIDRTPAIATERVASLRTGRFPSTRSQEGAPTRPCQRGTLRITVSAGAF